MTSAELVTVGVGLGGDRERSVMKKSVVRFDAPFWVALLAGTIFIGSLGCIGLAAAAQDAAKDDTSVVCVGPT